MATHVRVESSDIATPAKHVAVRIKAHLDAGRTVLWLVSGGSAIKVAVQARSLLGKLSAADKLHVALIDERFGDPGHKDSNALQLSQAGFDATGLTFHPVLRGQAIEATTLGYDEMLRTLFSQADTVIGLFGMGGDGHTAGLLPGNPLMESASLVGQFDGPDYQRITTTPALITQVDEAILYAIGSEKVPVLETFDTTDLPVSCLRKIPSLHIFSDYQRSQS